MLSTWDSPSRGLRLVQLRKCLSWFCSVLGSAMRRYHVFSLNSILLSKSVQFGVSFISTEARLPNTIIYFFSYRIYTGNTSHLLPAPNTLFTETLTFCMRGLYLSWINRALLGKPSVQTTYFSQVFWACMFDCYIKRVTDLW